MSDDPKADLDRHRDSYGHAEEDVELADARDVPTLQ
jgi:hypothetical protein